MRLKVKKILDEITLRCEALRMDAAFLVGMRPWITLQEILIMKQRLHLSINNLSDALPLSEISSLFKDLGSTIGFDGLATLYRLLKEDALRIGIPLTDVHLLIVQCPTSAYVWLVVMVAQAKCM